MNYVIEDQSIDTDGEGSSAHKTDPVTRTSKIRIIEAMAKTARDDALELDLKFEAYLLDMAMIALSEQSQKEAGKTV